MRELEYITDEEGRRYPTDQPFTQRDQGHRAADELVYVVISDVADVLRAEANRLVKLADKADALVKEAVMLWHPALTADDIPESFPVRPLADDDAAGARMTCGTCGLAWDDAIMTSITPTPSGRCPFEAFHSDSVDILADGWLPMVGEDDSEKLNDILRDAEQLDDVYVEWCADAGTVLVTLARYWEDTEEEGEGE